MLKGTEYFHPSKNNPNLNIVGLNTVCCGATFQDPKLGIQAEEGEVHEAIGLSHEEIEEAELNGNKNIFGSYVICTVSENFERRGAVLQLQAVTLDNDLNEIKMPFSIPIYNLNYPREWGKWVQEK